MVTIVFSHPWHGSFNKAILDRITSKYDKENTAYQIIDLPKDNFNPVLTESELALFNKGKALDSLVLKYQEMIKNSDKMIFMFPVWWGTIPAILKGFFDKVLLVNYAYSYENGWTPLLKIDNTVVISTSQSPTEMFKSSIGDNFVNMMLSAVGINNTVWLNCEETSTGTDDKREAFLNKVEETV